MKIMLVKTPRYGSKIKPSDKYDFYCQSTAGLIDPGLDIPIYADSQLVVGKKPSVIYSSPLKRAVQYAKQLGEVVIITEDLKEVGFELSTMVSRSEYEELGSKIVRQRFLERFMENKLGEPRTQIIERANRLIYLMRQRGEENVLCVSHSFMMKIMEARLDGYDLNIRPQGLAKYLLPSQRTYPFGGGFIREI